MPTLCPGRTVGRTLSYGTPGRGRAVAELPVLVSPTRKHVATWADWAQTSCTQMCECNHSTDTRHLSYKARSSRKLGNPAGGCGLHPDSGTALLPRPPLSAHGAARALISPALASPPAGQQLLSLLPILFFILVRALLMSPLHCPLVPEHP